MNSSVNMKALLVIHRAVAPMVNSGKAIDRIRMYVSAQAEVANYESIETQFGTLKIVASDYIPKGYCYVIEKPITKGGIGFNWVSKPKVTTSLKEGVN